MSGKGQAGFHCCLAWWQGLLNSLTVDSSIGWVFLLQFQNECSKYHYANKAQWIALIISFGGATLKYLEFKIIFKTSLLLPYGQSTEFCWRKVVQRKLLVKESVSCQGDTSEWAVFQKAQIIFSSKVCYPMPFCSVGF